LAKLFFSETVTEISSEEFARLSQDRIGWLASSFPPTCAAGITGNSYANTIKHRKHSFYKWDYFRRLQSQRVNPGDSGQIERLALVCFDRIALEKPGLNSEKGEFR
jgi:hypothetical protein